MESLSDLHGRGELCSLEANALPTNASQQGWKCGVRGHETDAIYKLILPKGFCFQGKGTRVVTGYKVQKLKWDEKLQTQGETLPMSQSCNGWNIMEGTSKNSQEPLHKKASFKPSARSKKHDTYLWQWRSCHSFIQPPPSPDDGRRKENSSSLFTTGFRLGRNRDLTFNQVKLDLILSEKGNLQYLKSYLLLKVITGFLLSKKDQKGCTNVFIVTQWRGMDYK